MLRGWWEYGDEEVCVLGEGGAVGGGVGGGEVGGGGVERCEKCVFITNKNACIK